MFKPESPIPPKFAFTYTDPTLGLDSEEIFLHYQAKSKIDQKYYSMRILNIHSEFVKTHYDIAATLFIQELLRLNSLYPNAILIETFEISEKKMGFACLPYKSLEKQQNSKVSFNIGKMISDVVNDIEFLWKNLKLRKFKNIITQTDVYQFEEGSNFFLGNWVKVVSSSASEKENIKEADSQFEISILSQENRTVNSRDLSEEIAALGVTVLELGGIKRQTIEHLRLIPNDDTLIYESAIRCAISKLEHLPVLLKKSLEQMLSLDVQKLPRIEDLKLSHSLTIEEEEKKDSPNRKPEIAIREDLILGSGYLEGKIKGIDIRKCSNY